MYSFYGGRPGNSFTIVTSFSTVQEMITAFQRGPAYTNVHYDEYVIINTEDKNNPTNGQIYRRGYDYSNEMGGAELIGTIVGPAGKAPLLAIDQYNKINNIKETDGFEINEQGYYKNMKSSGELTLNNEELIPGKDGNTFNDSIKWVSYSIRDDQGKDTIAYIGFKIPYPIIDFETSNINFYESTQAERIDEGNHPFYEKWKINIPKGQKGDSIKNFRVITPTENNVSNYTGKIDDLNKREILVYDYYVYQDSNGNPIDPQIAENNKQTLYIGDYNMIESITLSQQGYLTVYYTHNNAQQVNQTPISWIKELTLSNNGLLNITYNTGRSTTINEDNKITWINNILLSSDGLLSVEYNTGEQIPINNQNNPIRWIEDIALEDDGTFKVKYNTSNDYQNVTKITSDNYSSDDVIITFIDHINLTEDGLLEVYYNQDTNNPIIVNTYDSNSKEFNKIRWIRNVIYNTFNGNLQFYYNDDESVSFPLRLPVDLSIEHIEDDIDHKYKDKIAVHYADQTTDYKTTLNSVKKLRLSDDGHLLVQYTDQSMNTDAITETTVVLPTGSQVVTEQWGDLGLINPEVFGFKEESSTITNKYIIGILTPNSENSGFENLILDLNTNQFLSNNIQSIAIASCDLIIDPSNDNQININFSQNNYLYQIDSNLFGLKIIIKNVSNKGLSSSSSVNILINLLNFTFTLKSKTSETTVIDSDNLNSIKQKIQNAQESIKSISDFISMQQATDTEYIDPEKTLLESFKDLKQELTNTLEQFNEDLENRINNVINQTPEFKNLDAYLITYKLTNNQITDITRTNTKIGLWERTNNATKPNSTRLGPRLDTKNNRTDIFEGVAVVDQLGNQKHGYVLLFSHFATDGKGGGAVEASPYNNNYYFIPKSHISQLLGQGIMIPLGWGNSLAGKYIYIQNRTIGNRTYTVIRGHANNSTRQIVDGVSYRNEQYALVAVYGV